ncbi:MarR family winged helix-turn-helix transcriptional regulator [Nostoc sp. 106C]|uniref:MarR family winged helix-turn-helix transcriptional regulator n=1 Tax=Nostoc sp. 106C TaxID=1932667 RepID=UPI000A393FCD|nr:MarR family winged helix-turn-helix transcriptional regulator [Nostoc sp. 106C]OUL22535.1 MarR family transcriptional regulator [Nostoc sp. 106C]
MSPKKLAPEVTPEQCAAKMMETIPIIIKFFRTEMRRNASFLPESLSVPQFRALAFLDRHPSASLSQVAEHLGVTRATASTLTDRLVQKKLVSRVENPLERRHVVLNLTDTGKYHLQQIRSLTSARIATVLTNLPEEQMRSVVEGLTVLSNTFEQVMPE